MGWSSEVAICNGALALVGAESFTAFSDASKQAVLCNLFFEQCRDDVMRAFPWNFAIKRVDLGSPLASGDANAPVYEWSYGFVLPSSDSNYCLRVLDTENGEPHRVEGRYLYTNTSALKIKYIMRVVNPVLWDPQFKAALAANLAMMLAYPITKSLQAQQAMMNLYQGLLGAGYSVDSQEGTPEVIDSDELLNARYG